jgi:oxygen-independent coproporphyrinogen-3 oxidase
MLGLYIHVPFCIRRCPFCDFTLVTDAPDTLVDHYIQALCKEISSRTTPERVSSIYFGGGTPSILSTDHLAAIFHTLRKNFTLDENVEITLETNPEDITIERGMFWRGIGINRISLGVQSMNDQELKRLGRNHLEQNVMDGFDILKSLNFNNISVDLMFGLEDQSLDSWQTTLEKVIDMEPQHISTYNLTIEKNTKFDQEFASGELTLPSDELQAQMLIDEKMILSRSGFHPYEISNAAVLGFESRHNMLYWTGKPYLGFGVSAHSFEKTDAGYRRYWNTKNIPLYVKNLENGRTAIESEEILDSYTHLTERLMTGLRLKQGVDLAQLEKEVQPLPAKMKAQLQILVDQNMLQRHGYIIQIPVDKIPITNEILLRLFE